LADEAHSFEEVPRTTGIFTVVRGSLPQSHHRRGHTMGGAGTHKRRQGRLHWACSCRLHPGRWNE